MVDRDVVLAKVATIDRCLRRIAEAREPERDLRPVDRQDIVELNLQRAVQADIDLAMHVVSTEGWGLPDKVAVAFSILEEEGVLPPDLAERLRKMVGFRNIAVHEYQEVDPAIVEAIVAKHLDDLRELSRIVLERFEVG